MSKHIRYTCAKKKHPVLRKDCEKCEMYDPCAKDGKWCFVDALIAEHEPMLSENAMGSCVNASAPVMRDMSTVTINLGNGMQVDVLKEDIRKQIRENLGLKFGL